MLTIIIEELQQVTLDLVGFISEAKQAQDEHTASGLPTDGSIVHDVATTMCEVRLMNELMVRTLTAVIGGGQGYRVRDAFATLDDETQALIESKAPHFMEYLS